MRRYKKVIIWVAVADLLLLAALFVLCVLVDRRVDVGRSEKTSSTLDGIVSRATTKEAEFGSDIFDRPVVPSGEAMGIYMKTRVARMVFWWWMCAASKMKMASPAAPLMEKFVQGIIL